MLLSDVTAVAARINRELETLSQALRACAVTGPLGDHINDKQYHDAVRENAATLHALLRLLGIRAAVARTVTDILVRDVTDST